MGAGAGTDPKSDNPPCEELAPRHTDKYDAKVAEELINSSHILQFTFQKKDEPYPYVIHLPGRIANPPNPKKSADPKPAVLYAKGWLPCDMLDKLQPDSEGLPVNVSTCKAESIFCARSTFAHGLTWRSTVINGTAHILTFEKKGMKEEAQFSEQDVLNNEKIWALYHIVNGYIPDQWEHTRHPTRKEVDMVLVLRVDIDTEKSHTHVRHGIFKYAPEWESADPRYYWEGAIPIWETYGDPFYGNTEIEYPSRLKRIFDERSRKNEAYATRQACKESQE
ncbi:hypothetical protein BBP40_009110 [Aspergillus hancockii]|nr:hypothetical protein BBP40_009110 [Aspergillus hancockii]